MTAGALYNRILQRRGRWVIEREVADILDSHGLIFHISTDRGGDVASYPTNDEKWRDDVITLMKSARILICSPGATEGTLWEIGQIFANGFEGKTIFMCSGNS